MLKKYTSLLVVALLVIHLAGFYVYFVVRLGEIRMTMREKLADLPIEQLDVVRIPVLQFKKGWIEEREMQWQGKMYDIARVERREDTMIVYCVHDEDEDGLLNFIGAVIDLSQQDTRPTPSTVQQFLALKYVMAECNCPERSFRIFEPDYGVVRIPPYSIESSPTTPPPRG